jgi:hypothetical protein
MRWRADLLEWLLLVAILVASISFAHIINFLKARVQFKILSDEAAGISIGFFHF